MENVISFEKLSCFAYTNAKLLAGKPKAVAVEFFGLGNTRMLDEDPETAVYLAGKDILYVFPYNNPWNWMNRAAVEYTDAVLDAVFAGFGLGEDTPIVSCGGSMGGHSALMYTLRAKRTPALCVANCPVCDLPYHYTERPDLPRTLFSAYGDVPGTPEEALKTGSPLHLAESMPDIPYVIFHCTADQAVNKEMHSDRFVAAMRPAHRVDYRIIPDRGHCDLGEEGWKEYREVIAGIVP